MKTKEEIICEVCKKHPATNFECSKCYIKGWEFEEDKLKSAREQGKQLALKEFKEEFVEGVIYTKSEINMILDKKAGEKLK